ncbi:MAG: DUF3500 domain-containing protein [Pirellulales bacterium]
MADTRRECPDCASDFRSLDRRDFLKTASVAAVAGSASLALSNWAVAKDAPAVSGKAESVVKTLYDSLKEEQRKKMCFAWDYTEKKRGLLRTYVANNWNITEEMISSEFYNKDQQAMIREIFKGIVHPEWVSRIDKQLEDDAGGYGEQQSIAIFGQPGTGKFEFVMTGRHMTIRCDGDSAEHVAFGGPIFYGHAVEGNEKPNHPGNVFWPQALAANKVYEMLDTKQREQALSARRPREQDVAFQGPNGKLPGIAVTEMSSDQQDELKKVLGKLVEPYHQADRDEAMSCLKAQGGLEKCSLAFYKEGDLGDDKVWDCWRLEGPAFVWYFRGAPHVHVWVNIAADPSVKTNSIEGQYPV